MTTRLAIASVVVTLLIGLMVHPVAAASNVNLSKIMGGYDRPVLVTHAPGAGRTIFIVEQTGRIKRATYQDGAWKKLGSFLDLSSKVINPKSGGSEQGLLGLAFHPDYQSNGRFYVNYTRKASGGNHGDTVIEEYRRANAGSADPDSRRRLLVVNQPGTNHNGGHMAFGPDKLLYIGLGDGAIAGTSQKLTTRLGKMLRIDPLDPDGAGPKKYRTPSGNPRVGKSGINDIWSWGLRNPWRFSFDRKTGNLWIADVGQGAREEVNRSKSGNNGKGAGKAKNYGWNRCEGPRRYPNTGQKCTFGAPPVHAYSHGHGRCSVTGGYVFRGPTPVSWRGLYVGGDFCGRLFVLDGKGKVKLSRVTNRQISSFGEDADGRLFLTDLFAGGIYRVNFSGERP